MPSGVYERPEPVPASYDALAVQVRVVSEARRARRARVVGGRPALRDSLRRLAEVAEALAESETV